MKTTSSTDTLDTDRLLRLERGPQPFAHTDTDLRARGLVTWTPRGNFGAGWATITDAGRAALEVI